MLAGLTWLIRSLALIILIKNLGRHTRERLLQAQEQVKLFYDTKHLDVAFLVCDWVWVKLLQ
jgi:hypothetical protein